MPPVDATKGAVWVEDATVEGDATVGETVSLATLPVDATDESSVDD